MRAPLLLGLFLFSSQELAVAAEPVLATVCEILKRPHDFDGKMTKLRAKVSVGFEHAVLLDSSCEGSIWFSIGDGMPGNHTFVAYSPIESWLDRLFLFSYQWRPITNRPALDLRNDAEWKSFRSLLDARHIERKTGRRCSNCPLYDLTATFVGRLDHSERRYGLYKTKDGETFRTYGGGYGHLSKWNVRLVAESVSELVAIRIDEEDYERKQ